MTTIPERIQAEAIQIAEDVRHRWRALGTDLNKDEPTWLPIAQALLAAEKRGREEARATIIAAHDLLRADDRYGALAHLPAGGVECEEMVEKAVDLLAAAIRSTN